MAFKKSVRITDAAADVLAAFSDGDEMNWSGAINSMAEHIGIMTADIQPRLTESEWKAMYCCYNGYAPHPNPTEEARLLPWHVDQGYQYDEQVKGFLASPEGAKTLIGKLEQMTTAERLAVIVAAKAFWRTRLEEGVGHAKMDT